MNQDIANSMVDLEKGQYIETASAGRYPSIVFNVGLTISLASVTR